MSFFLADGTKCAQRICERTGLRECRVGGIPSTGEAICGGGRRGSAGKRGKETGPEDAHREPSWPLFFQSNVFDESACQLWGCYGEKNVCQGLFREGHVMYFCSAE